MDDIDLEYSAYIRNKKRRRYNKRNRNKDKSNQKIYEGEESFMNVVHPLEQSSSSNWQKSSPLQMAIMDCIMKNNGSASEQQILDYIKEKWHIINKYSRRGSLIEPSLRVIRLNCAVKKKGRHLFVSDPKFKDHWMLNTKLRKNSRVLNEQRILMEKQNENNQIPEKNDFLISNENESSEQSDDDIDSFENIILEFLIFNQKFFKFDEICDHVKKYEEHPGIFKRLPLERRVKAILISFKLENRVTYDSLSDSWGGPSLIC